MLNLTIPTPGGAIPTPGAPENHLFLPLLDLVSHSPELKKVIVQTHILSIFKKPCLEDTDWLFFAERTLNGAVSQIPHV